MEQTIPSKTLKSTTTKKTLWIQSCTKEHREKSQLKEKKNEKEDSISLEMHLLVILKCHYAAIFYLTQILQTHVTIHQFDQHVMQAEHHPSMYICAL